jgi:U3 small nucleolar RNA-associated protein 23
MRISRHKSLKKALRFYKAAFDFVDPYHVVCDPSFVEASVENKFNVKDDLSNLLAGRVTPMVTSCVMSHLRRNGRVNPAALGVGKSCFRLKCFHDEKKPLSASDCIVDQLKNENQRHFLVASQDGSLTARARNIPGTPVLSIHGNMLHLEPPSERSKEAAQHRELKRRLPKLSEITDASVEESGEQDPVGGEKAKRSKKRKGANPLSCLPRKLKVGHIEEGSSSTGDKAKKRIRSRKTQIIISSEQ